MMSQRSEVVDAPLLRPLPVAKPGPAGGPSLEWLREPVVEFKGENRQAQAPNTPAKNQQQQQRPSKQKPPRSHEPEEEEDEENDDKTNCVPLHEAGS